MSVGFIYNKEIDNYQLNPPFNPPQQFPELSKFNFNTDPKNKIYKMVRDLIAILNLDKDRFNSPEWNPFSEFIKEGDIVVIKPNLVKHFHPLGFKGVLATITHASIIRPIIDYVLLALNGKGKIIIADTPLEKTDFYLATKLNKLRNLIEFYKEFLSENIDLIDMRSYKLLPSKSGYYYNKIVNLKGPLGGYIKINLKNESELSELDNGNPNYYTLADKTIKHFDVISKKIAKTNEFHQKNKHIYKIPKIILNANVIISVPKLKTHRMAGISLNLKNMIGICEKIYLPHHRRGSPPIGDAYPHVIPSAKIIRRKALSKINAYITYFKSKLELFLVKIKDTPFIIRNFKTFYQKIINRIEIKEDWWGAWSGNDTIWRTIFDLNKILLYSNSEGRMLETKTKKYFNIIDGIIGQEGEGPMTGIPRGCGVLIGGFDPVACDTLAAHIMGYDISRIKIINQNKFLKKYKLGNCQLKDTDIISNIKNPLNLNLNFKLPEGYIDLAR